MPSPLPSSTLTLLLPLEPFAVAKSVFPSPLKSPMAIATGSIPVVKLVTVWNPFPATAATRCNTGTETLARSFVSPR